MPWKPEGYPEVSPYLVVEDAGATLSFLEELFGAAPLRRYDMPDGSVNQREMTSWLIQAGLAKNERSIAEGS